MADVKDPSDTGGKLIAASKVNSTTVYDTAGEKVGSIYDVMIDKSTGKAEYAIMSFGGFLAMGSGWIGTRGLKHTRGSRPRPLLGGVDGGGSPLAILNQSPGLASPRGLKGGRIPGRIP